MLMRLHTALSVNRCSHVFIVMFHAWTWLADCMLLQQILLLAYKVGAIHAQTPRPSRAVAYDILTFFNAVTAKILQSDSARVALSRGCGHSELRASLRQGNAASATANRLGHACVRVRRAIYLATAGASCAHMRSLRKRDRLRRDLHHFQLSQSAKLACMLIPREFVCVPIHQYASDPAVAAN
jgi:hypothetical protein